MVQLGIHEGRQVRMEFRGRKSAMTMCFESEAAVVIIALTLGGMIATSFVPNIVFPNYDEVISARPSNYSLDDFQEEFGLSTDLVENCVGGSCWFFGLTLFLCFFAFLSFYVFQRVFPVAGFVLILSMFAVLTPYVIFVRELESFFEYVKLFSVFAAGIFASTFRMDNILRAHKSEKVGYYAESATGPWPRFVRFLGSWFPPQSLLDGNMWCWILWGTLAVNISEAALGDFTRGNYANSGVGLWLVAAMPRPYFSTLERRLFFFTLMRPTWGHIVFIDASAKGFYDLVYETDWFWVFAYITWNAAFSYDERKEHFVIICVVLVASLLVNLPNNPLKLDPHLYVQGRTYTLLARYIILAFYDVYEEYADSTYWFDEDIKDIWGYCNVAIIGIYMIYKLAHFKDGSSATSIDGGLNDRDFDIYKEDELESQRVKDKADARVASLRA